MSANQPEKTIDEEVLNHGGRSITYFELYKKRQHNYEQYLIDRKYADQKLIAALSAMLREIRGEDEYDKYMASGKFDHSQAARDERDRLDERDSVRAEFDQRAAKLGFKL